MFLEKEKKKQKVFARSQGVVVDLRVNNLRSCYFIEIAIVLHVFFIKLFLSIGI